MDARAALGAYDLVALCFSVEAGQTGGQLLIRDVDATVAVSLVTMPFPGFVAAISVDAVGGTMVDDVFLVQVNGTPVAASSFTVSGVTTLTQKYDSAAVTFNANQTVAVEIDSVGTGRDGIITLWVVMALP